MQQGLRANVPGIATAAEAAAARGISVHEHGRALVRSWAGLSYLRRVLCVYAGGVLLPSRDQA